VLNQLLNLTRPLFVLDTETTGTDVQNDRIVEVGFQQWTGAEPCKACHGTGVMPEAMSSAARCDVCHGIGRIDGGMVKEYRTLINPGVPIPASATKIHGITDGRMRACQVCGLLSHDDATTVDHPFKVVPTFKQLAANLAKGFTDCDFAGQNVRFDLRIIQAEMARAGVTWDYSKARIIDSSQLERLAVPRSLSHLHEKYVGLKHDGAHGALSDVRAAATVIMKQLEAHDALPRDLDKLHELSWPGWIDGGKFKFIDGVPCFGQWGKFAGQPMRKADNGYWDFILKADFPADVKRLAAEAKLGKYPEAR
jgi:DNA polymerase-3 subunit epsilon